MPEFIESPRFPECVSLGAVGGPGFRTDIVTVSSGHEYRNQALDKALGRWEVGHNVMGPEDYEPLRNFFLICGGMASGFRFRDHTDYYAAAGEGVCVLVSGTTWQMYKRYGSGSYEYLRKIQKPVPGTVTITPPGGASIDYTTGLILSAFTPTWVGQFDVPCRFGTDDMTAETINKRADGALLIGWRTIPIREIRL